MIPVIWLNLDLESIPRGYWDQGMLEELFDGRLRPMPYQFQHYVVHGLQAEWPAVGGAVVVLPGRFHVRTWERVQERIRSLAWCVLIVTSDEESLFPYHLIDHPNMKLWIMTPMPGADYPPDTRFIGEGYRPGTPDLVA